MQFIPTSPPIIAVAPMMGYTDRYFRYLMRLLAPSALLYTEMTHANALVFGKTAELLVNDQIFPLALQLGGCEPTQLAKATELAIPFGYQEINLNVGCPSPRVQQGRFGACLMKEPELVAECVAAMQKVASGAKVTVKTRIGVDEQEGYEQLEKFIRTVYQAGCQDFIIHARKAWLKGLSPRQNREIPPLDYSVVYRVKQQFPRLNILINGGINDSGQVAEHLGHVDGVMLGRAALQQPLWIRTLVQQHHPEIPLQPIDEVVKNYLDFVSSLQTVSLSRRLKPLLALFYGRPGAVKWRRCISEQIARNLLQAKFLLEMCQS